MPKYFIHDIRFLGRGLNPARPEHEAVVLSTRLQSSIKYDTELFCYNKLCLVDRQTHSLQITLLSAFEE
jgi:hypothetical protein